ncbi:MFS transporter [Nocardioides szechwanensis]|uniref:Drug resistance transporter, EmrB/QacA subfamily n=1 Tax=Nocardioides szechwanensis TaxID=1005944 RepID=A0A1H0LZX6_9ACTN|nr:MFS transporter [Nocardioides szechwanensis]GEP36295.1 MFS transporter [Nocardioides szechwanensis]SDO73601.1 drug resistance transporter, EmrB/QacA subfamily [Nocardioides szechwanensis]
MTDVQAAEGHAPEPAQPDEKELHLGWALVLISIAQLMVVLDGTITNIALPYIGNDLHITQANLAWIVTGYALAFGGLLLLGGRLGDLYGRRRIFALGLTVFAIASLIGGFAQNETMLLGSRALQGLGAALAAPAALALITTTFPAGPKRNRAFAVYAAMSGAGAAVGLILGGWLTGLNPEIFGTEVAGWRFTFLINTPIGLAAAALAPRFLRESESHKGELDVPGAITGTFGLLGIVYGLTRAGDERYGWGDTWTIASLVAGVVLLVVFALIESRVEHPLLPIRIFQNRTRASSFLAMMLAPAAMFSMFYFLSLFIQQIVGYSPLRAGFAFLPFSFGIVIGAGLSSNLVNRVNPRYLAGVGTLLASFSLFMFSRLSIDDSTSGVLGQLLGGGTAGEDVNYWAHIFPYIITMSVGMGLVFVPLTLTAVHHLRAEDSGIGSGVLNTMQQVGGALGLATLSTVSLHFINNRTDTVVGPLTQGLTQANVDPSTPVPGADISILQAAVFQSTFTEGATNAFFVGALLMLAASVVVWIFLDVKHEELATDGPEGVHVG